MRATAASAPINHHGPHYQVAGPLNMPRGPQGRPVFVQAGSSDTGRRFAARHAEAVFTAQMEKATAKDFYADLKTLAADEGRAPDQVLILPGLSPVIGAHRGRGAAHRARTERPERPGSRPQAAVRPLRRPRFLPSAAGRGRCRRRISPTPPRCEAARSRTEVIIGLVRREKPTLRQLLGYMAGARGHFVTAGTPEQIADLIEDWFRDGAADGFNVMPPVLPAMLEVFVAEVVPLLQRRGLFRTEYAGETLREHYGLKRPDVRF